MQVALRVGDEAAKGAVMTASGAGTSNRAGAAQVAERMAEAAANLLAALDAEQRRRAAFGFPADEERRRWFYTPTDHGGVPLVELSPMQQRQVHQLLATGLSLPGYNTAAVIMGIENVLDRKEGWHNRFARDLAPFARGRDPNMYYISVFGEPGSERTWGWRFGGHHVSLHYTIVEGQVVSPLPTFFGADPAESPLVGGNPLRPLAGEEDLGRDLIHALDGEQHGVALISPVAPPDLVIANRSTVEDGALPPHNREIWRERLEGAPLERSLRLQSGIEEMLGIRAEHLEAVRFTLVPKGLPASRMTPAQREILIALLRQYVDRLPEELAAIETDKLNASRLDAVHFAWAGGLERRQPHYYRLQGPRLLIEYDNTQGGGNHIHSVWRDPEGDFGADLLAQHYARAH